MHAREVQLQDLSAEAKKPLRNVLLAPSQPTPRRFSDPTSGATARRGSIEVIPPKHFPRSFACGARDEPYSESEDWAEPLGRIETRVSLTPPTQQDVEEIKSFSAKYQQTHKRKPHVVAFVNSRSGGQIGGMLMKALTQSIGSDQGSSEAFAGEVCDLSEPEEPENTIEALAEELEDHMQRKLLVCGGDGTVTWILTALEQCKALEGKLHLLPVAIVPLGTGNDLARSLGWGPSLRSVSDILKYLCLVAKASPVLLDQWRLVLRPHEELAEDHKLHSPGSHPRRVDDQDLSSQLLGDLADSLNDEGLAASMAEASGGPSRDIYLGFWQNYFSIGMDAKVAGAVDHSRSQTWLGRCCFRRGGGKFCYGWQGLRHSCNSRLLTNSLESFAMAEPSPEELLGSCGGVASLPSAPRSSAAARAPQEVSDHGAILRKALVQGRRGRLRQLMLVNINSYAAGLNVLPAGSTATPPSAHDGILEVLAVRNLLSTMFMFGGCTKPAYLGSATKLAFRLSAGEWMQLDGEPWHLDGGCDVMVEHHRSVTMLCAPPDAPWWQGHVDPGYWGARTAVAEEGEDDEDGC